MKNYYTFGENQFQLCPDYTVPRITSYFTRLHFNFRHTFGMILDIAPLNAQSKNYK